jgi:hypothetical protein
MLLESNGVRRADANETGIVAGALVAAGIAAVQYDYPELQFRATAPLHPGVDAGDDTYTWQEYDVVGMAKIIANNGDDLPDVSAHTKTNTGNLRSLGNSFSYTTQDLRRVIAARKNGRQNVVLDVERVALAREMMERKKDYIAAYGDTTHNLPGVLANSNVTVLTASAPATGSSKSFTGGDKIGIECLKDLRTGMYTVATQSKGAHRANLVAMSVEYLEKLATMPLIASSENQITVLQQFMLGNPTVKILAWNRCAIADAAGTGNRVLFLKSQLDVLGLVEPLPFEAQAPQRQGLRIVTPCESRYGGIFIKKPLAAAYMDFV